MGSNKADTHGSPVNVSDPRWEAMTAPDGTRWVREADAMQALLVAGTDFRIMARAEGYAMVTVPSVPGVPFVVDERRIAGLGGVEKEGTG
jgi:hypothetical protein